VLRFLQDQETVRPGESTPFRRRHQVFVAHLPDAVQRTVASVELDDTNEAPLVWGEAAAVAGLHLYPALGPVLVSAVHSDAAGWPAEVLVLPTMTDKSYRWR
jgi:hypothetical protein